MGRSKEYVTNNTTIPFEKSKRIKVSETLSCEISTVTLCPVDFGFEQQKIDSKLALFMKDNLITNIGQVLKRVSENVFPNTKRPPTPNIIKKLPTQAIPRPPSSALVISKDVKNRVITEASRSSILKALDSYLEFHNEYLKKNLSQSKMLQLFPDAPDALLSNSELGNHFFRMSVLNNLYEVLNNNQADLIDLWLKAHDFFGADVSCGTYNSEMEVVQNDDYFNSKYLGSYYLRYYPIENPKRPEFMHNVHILCKDIFLSMKQKHRGQTIGHAVLQEKKELDKLMYYIERLYENVNTVYEKNHLYNRLNRVLNKLNFCKVTELESFLNIYSIDFEFLRYPDLDVITSIRILKFLQVANLKTFENIPISQNDPLIPIDVNLAGLLSKSQIALDLKEILNQTSAYEYKVVSDPKFDRLFEVVPSIFEPFMLPMKTLMAIIDQTLIVFNHGINSIVTNNYVQKKSTYISNELLDLKLFIKNSGTSKGLLFHSLRYADYLAYIFNKDHNRLFNILKNVIKQISKQFDWKKTTAIWIDSILDRYYSEFFTSTRNRFGFKDSSVTVFFFDFIQKLQAAHENIALQKQIEQLLKVTPKELPKDVAELPSKRVVRDVNASIFDKPVSHLPGFIPPVPRIIQKAKTKDNVPKRKLAAIIDVYAADHPSTVPYKNRSMDSEVIDKVSLYYLFLTPSFSSDELKNPGLVTKPLPKEGLKHPQVGQLKVRTQVVTPIKEEKAGEVDLEVIDGLIERSLPLISFFQLHNISVSDLISFNGLFSIQNSIIFNRVGTNYKEHIPPYCLKRIFEYVFPSNLFVLSLVCKQFFKEAHKIPWPEETATKRDTAPCLVDTKVKVMIQKQKQHMVQLCDLLKTNGLFLKEKEIENRLVEKGVYKSKEIASFLCIPGLQTKLTNMYSDDRNYLLTKFYTWYYKLMDMTNFEAKKLSVTKASRDIFKRMSTYYIFLLYSAHNTFPAVSKIGAHPVILMRGMMKSTSKQYPNVNLLMFLSEYCDINPSIIKQSYQYRKYWREIDMVKRRFWECSAELERIHLKRNLPTEHIDKMINNAKEMIKKNLDSIDKTELVELECEIIKYSKLQADYYQYYARIFGKQSKMSLEDAMFLSISLNHYEELKKIVGMGANINATKNGFDITTRSLISKNQEMISFCHSIRVEYLVVKQPRTLEEFPVSSNLIYYAIDNHNLQAVELMIKLDPSLLYQYVGKLRPLDYCITKFDKATEVLLKAMLTDNQKNNSIVLTKACLVAIDNENMDALGLLLNEEPSLAEYGELFDTRFLEPYYANTSLILYALRKRKLKAASLLVEKNRSLVDVRFSSLYTNHSNDPGITLEPISKTSLGNLIMNGTPLTFAVETNQLQMAIMLYEKGADVSVRKNGMDLSELAEATENSEMISWTMNILQKTINNYKHYKFEVEYVDQMLNLYRKRFKMVVNQNDSVSDFVKKAKLRCSIRGQYELQYYDRDFNDMMDVVDLKDMQLKEDELNLIKLKRVSLHQPNPMNKQMSGLKVHGKYEMFLGTVWEEKYKVLKMLAEGGFGVVFECEVLGGSEPNRVAIKVITGKGNPQKQLQDAENESNLVQQLDHENIVRIIETFQVQSDFSVLFCIVMELYSFGDVMTSIMNQRVNNEPINVVLIWKIMVQIASAVDYIHSHCIMHRDIYNPKEKSIEVVLGDFGIAKENSHTTKQTYAGSLSYLSPELLLNQPYGSATDMYSLGVTLFQLLSLDTSTSICSMLIHSEDNCFQELRVKIMKNYEDFLHCNDETILERLIGLMQKLLKFKPQSRLNSSELVGYLRGHTK